jgi:hypothetical protein
MKLCNWFFFPSDKSFLWFQIVEKKKQNRSKGIEKEGIIFIFFNGTNTISAAEQPQRITATTVAASPSPVLSVGGLVRRQIASEGCCDCSLFLSVSLSLF